LKFDYIKNE